MIGIGLIGAGTRFTSRGLALFGQALAGGGVVVLYVSIYSALHFYQLISPAPAFALMALVTAGAAWLADRQRSQPLAALALLGGFATPMLVGGEHGRQVVLFTYIAMLIGGAATLARRHTWPLLSAASYLCTFLLVIAWFFSSYEAVHWLRTELFLTLYIALFAYLLWTLLASRDRSPQAQLAVAILATAPLAYHLASIVLLNEHPAAWLLYLVLATVAGLAVSQRAQAAWLRVGVLLLVGLPAIVWLRLLEYPRWNVAAVGTMFVLYGLHLVAQWEASDDGEQRSSTAADGDRAHAAERTAAAIRDVPLPRGSWRGVESVGDRRALGLERRACPDRQIARTAHEPAVHRGLRDTGGLRHRPAIRRSCRGGGLGG